MLTLKLINEKEEIIEKRSHQNESYLAFKQREYQEGEKIVLEVDEIPQFVWIQVDEAISPSLIYLTKKSWEFPILTTSEQRRAYSQKIFDGQRHYVRAYLPKESEVNSYRNLALNSHDQKESSGVFPHAYANVETRNDSTFFARNAIDGIIANDDHGSFPYQSWGINQQQDAEITIDFGRNVLVDKMALVLRADYPHDSFWTDVTLEFSDGEQVEVKTTNQSDRQFFNFEEKKTTFVTLKNLIKNEDDSPFPALTQWEVYGRECI